MRSYSLPFLFPFLFLVAFPGSSNAQQQPAEVIIPVIGTFAGSIDFSPDGSRIAVAAGWRARVYDVETGEFIFAVPDSAETLLLTIQYSPDGRYLLVVRGSGEAKIFDAVTGEFIHMLEGPPDGSPIQSRYDAVWSPDGSRLYTTGKFDSLVYVWDAKTWEFIYSLRGHRDIVRSLSLSQDGTRLLSTDEAGWTMLWDAASGTLLQQLAADTSNNPAGASSSGALSPDGKIIATTKIALTSPTWVRLWDAETGASIGSLKTPLSSMYDLQFSPDGAYLLGGGKSTRGYIWRMSDSEQLFVLSGHTSRILAVDYSPDSRRVATGSDDGTVRIWSPDYPASVRDRGIVGSSMSAFTVYPNPARDRLQLSVALPKPMHISIALINLLGQNVGLTQEYVLPQGDQVLSIALPSLAPGRYFAILTTEEEIVQLPVVIL